jgi:hypothetical protein
VNYPITIKTHWFPGELRDVCRSRAAVLDTREMREHILLNMSANGATRFQIAHPGETSVHSVPFEKWNAHPLGPGFDYEDFLEQQYFWPGQTSEGPAKFGARNCDVIKSTPGPADRTHYAQVKTWIDPSIGFPVYVEKIVKETGTVKEFTSYGVRQEEGHWFAHQIEVKSRGQAGSTLLISTEAAPKQNSLPPISARPHSPTSRRLMHAALWIAAIATGLLATGVLYERIGDWRDRRRYAGSGRWVPIANGAKLYLFELGTGEPTVLFEAGIGATHLNWCHIQESIADSARTASYDRCGLGWSSRCRTSRVPGNIATELHQMLDRAGLKPPFILVGHSFGGLVMRRYALLYPGEVAGVVLIDPMRCDQWPPLDPSKQSQLDLGRRLIRFAMPVASCGSRA